MATSNAHVSFTEGLCLAYAPDDPAVASRPVPLPAAGSVEGAVAVRNLRTALAARRRKWHEQREALRVKHMAKLKVDADVIKGHRSIVEHFADEDKRREEAERAAYEAALEARRAAKHVATGPEFWAALRDHQAFLRQRRAEADARRQGEAAKFRALQPRPPSLDVTGES